MERIAAKYGCYRTGTGRYGRMTRYASVSASKDIAQFAGLGEGKGIHVSPERRWYNFAAVFPVVNTALISALEKMGAKSFSTGLRMLLSDAPAISQEASTSQRAMPRRRSIAFLQRRPGAALPERQKEHARNDSADGRKRTPPHATLAMASCQGSECANSHQIPVE